jgi:biotin transporter BioY
MSSGGYIVGFIAAAYVVGFLCERGLSSSIWILPTLLLGNVLVYVPGLIQLSLFAPSGKTLAWGLYPFIAGDLLKLMIAALLVPAAWGAASHWLGSYGGSGRSNSSGGRWL